MSAAEDLSAPPLTIYRPPPTRPIAACGGDAREAVQGADRGELPS